jgi:hypothetical protein
LGSGDNGGAGEAPPPPHAAGLRFPCLNSGQYAGPAGDLAAFLAALDPAIPVTALGVGSNVIVRDGGIPGVVIRLMGRAWGEVMKTGELELMRALARSIWRLPKPLRNTV